MSQSLLCSQSEDETGFFFFLKVERVHQVEWEYIYRVYSIYSIVCCGIERREQQWR